MNVFRDIITLEPPVLQTENNSNWSNYTQWRNAASNRKYQFSNGDFMDELYDSLKLTRTILPGLLPLLNLDDYKWPVMRLLAKMVDSNLVSTKEYDAYFNRFLLEAKLELKKQVIAEKKKAIKKAEESKTAKSSPYIAYDGHDEAKDNGNDDLSIYAKLLLPYIEKNIPVRSLFQGLLESADTKLKYSTMLLLLQNGKSIPDSLPGYFAAMDDYRYELYSDLKDRNKQHRFPAKYNNHLDLAKSKLLDMKSYDKPDSLVYIDRLPATEKEHKGFVYFFKYKQKKDDDIWKIATVGLVPEDPKQFEFDEEDEDVKNSFSYYGNSDDDNTDFTELTDTKLKDDEPVTDQLNAALKKLLYSTHKSAKEFYDSKENNRNGLDITRKY